jgi:predicted lipid-binding transport protein (Tim44 family)
MVAERDVSTLSLPTMLAGLLTSTLWGLFALLTKNIFVGIPNVAGMTIFILQLSLYGRHRNSESTLRSRAALTAAKSEEQSLVN